MLFKFGRAGLSLICCSVIRGLASGFPLLWYFSGRDIQVSQYLVSVKFVSLIHERPHL